jgi:hypothetical protein
MDTKHKGVSYVGDINGYSRYTMFLEGRRVFDILVDGETPATDLPEGMATPPAGHSVHTIHIAMVDAPIVARQATKGYALRAPHADENGMGYRIVTNSIRSYVQGREAYFLARLFVPAA